MGSGCFSARGAGRKYAAPGCGSVQERPDVRALLQRLEAEQPEDLGPWLRDYADKLLAQKQRPSGVHRDGMHDVLDWRFFIFSAEREVLEYSRSAAREAEQARKDVGVASPHLCSFIPQTIMKLIGSGAIKRGDYSRVVYEDPIHSTYNPLVESFDAAVVFMDASGFTALTEKLAQQPNGAEQIGACLNGFFTPLIKIVQRFGGDILKFSGDALTIVWRAEAPRELSQPSIEVVTTQDLRMAATSELTAAALQGEHDTGGGSAANAAAAVTLACCCCLKVQEQVAHFGTTPIEGLSLTLHVGVGYGPLRVLQLGGLMNRWEFCAAGPPLEEVAVAEPLAKSGEVVVSPSVLRAFEGCGFLVAPLAANDQHPGYMLLVGKSSGSEALPHELEGCDAADAARDFSLDKLLVERYVPRAILRLLRVSESPELLAEMRQISVIFLSVSGLDPGRSDADATRTQLMVRLLQRSCYALEGSINKFLVDDKGMLLLACFGLPPLNHYTDDPLRAVLAAARFCDLLREENLRGRVGVATGKTWCGVVGSLVRREYTVLGDTVNTSARLMANAKVDTVLVDAATQAACKSFFAFEPLGAISVKGKSQQLQVFEFTGNMDTTVAADLKRLNPKLLAWPEWPVKAKVEAVLEAQLAHPGGSGVVFVSGGPGCGKTEAAEHVKAWAAARGFVLLGGQNMNPTCTFAVPRLCWQEVFRALVDAASEDPHWAPMVQAHSSQGWSRSIYQLLTAMIREADGDSGLLGWAPLLNLVLPRLDLNQKAVQAMLERDEQHASTRQSRLAELCAKAVEGFARFGTTHRGTVILVHFKHSTSFFQEIDKHDGLVAGAIGNLCMRLRESPQCRPLILCVVSRKSILKDEGLLRHARACGGHVSVGHLTQDETQSYMASMYGAADASRVARGLSDHIHAVCGGNPYGIGILCKQLQELQILQAFGKGGVGFAPGWEESPKLHKVPYPEVLLGMAMAAFEKLSPSDQELLKAAAVFCGEPWSEDFSEEFGVMDVVGGLLADRSCWPAIERQCTSLTEMGILQCGQEAQAPGEEGWPEEADSTRIFRFGSHLLRRAASMLILQERRNFIHGELVKRSRTRRCSRPFTHFQGFGD